MRAVMRISVLLLVLFLVAVFYMRHSARPDVAAPAAVSISTRQPALLASSGTTTKRIDFATQLRPIFESRCTPCHFAGGKMYQRLPFDRPETIIALNKKLFTRIKDEQEQRLISEFLAQQSEQDQSRP